MALVFVSNELPINICNGYNFLYLFIVNKFWTKLKIILDNNLKRFSKIYAAAGHPNAVFGIDLNQFIILTSAEIEEFTEWEHQN